MSKRKHYRPAAQLLTRLFNAQNGRCAYCGDPMLLGSKQSNHPKHASKDHIIPVSKGGVTDAWNLVCSCRQCNQQKGSKPLIVYLSQITGDDPKKHPLYLKVDKRTLVCK